MTISDHRFSAEINGARQLAREAGARILEHYAANFEVHYKDKAGADPVTQADHDANRIIVDGLMRLFPADGILAEESPASQGRMSCHRLWCVDPVDGTRDFVDRNGQFVVMIGLAVAGRARLGVVFQPTEDLLLWGADGVAFAEHKGQTTPLRVSRCSDPVAATMVVSRSHRSTTVSTVAEALGIGRELPLGSVGLKVARICQATADIYLSVSDRTREWDACAPNAILEAAGGRMTDVCGAPLLYNKPETNTPRGLLATNGLLHDRCVEAIQPIVQARGWGSTAA